MSRDSVEDFIRLLESSVDPASINLEDPDAASVVAAAASHGIDFTEADLKSALNTRICNAESLPRPWGWPLARKMGLVRS